MRPSFDAIIVGQGLAGTTLAWTLQDAGWNVLVIDRGEATTASRISAGLITPITGMRFGVAWTGDELDAVRAFYRRIELLTGKTIFFERTALRLFASGWEQRLWDKRRHEPELAQHVVPNPAPSDLQHLQQPDAPGFAMRAAQLDVALYLSVSRAHLRIVEADLDWSRDVVETTDGVTVAGHDARMVIACEGFAGSRNPHFDRVAFKAAKGDILTVRFAAPVPPVSLHKGIWLAPTADPTVCKVGATFDWFHLDCQPSPAARAELADKLRALIRVDFEIVDHQAAVRPIIRLSQPRIGTHPQRRRIGYFNGLGTKGALRAPLFAARLRDHLLDGADIPDTLDVRTLVSP